MRRVLLILSLLGSLAFGGVLALSFASPLTIERAARETLRIEVERRAGERIDTLSDTRIAELARRSLRRNEQELARAREAMHAGLAHQVAMVFARMLSPDCPCRRNLEERVREWEEISLAPLRRTGERLTGLVESAYASVATDLLREVRIFTGSNAVAFSLLGLVALLRRTAGPQLALSAVALVGAVACVGGSYLFSQDWLHTIVFGDYVGLAYCVYLAGVALALADVLLNRARITTGVLNAFGSVVGSVPIVPC